MLIYLVVTCKVKTNIKEYHYQLTNWSLVKNNLPSRFFIFALASLFPLIASASENDFLPVCEPMPDAEALSPYRTYGFSSPARTADLAFASGGIVSKILVKQGDYVREGESLLLLAPRSEQDARLSAKAKLKVLLDRYTSAVTLGKNHYMAEVEIAEIESSIAEARYQLANIEREIEELTLRAPFDGLVESTLIEVGEYASLGQAGMRLSDISQQKVTADFFPGGRSKLCSIDEECSVFIGHGGTINGPYSLDFMVPLTQGNRGMFQVGVYADLPKTVGFPVDFYLVPMDICTTND